MVSFRISKLLVVVMPSMYNGEDTGGRSMAIFKFPLP